MHPTVVQSFAKESSRRVFCREMLSLFLLVLFGAYSVNSADEVIVIGAGASGLAAARALTDAGKYKVTILEARSNRYGGRIWTNTESFQNATGPEVDMGASYIHHADDTNSVVKLHREFNLPMLEMNSEAILVVRERDSKPYTRTRVEGAETKVEKAFETVGNISPHLKKDISIYTALRQVNQSQLIDDPLSQTFVALQEFSFGSSINNISAKYVNAGYADVSWPEAKIPALGYSKMLDRIVQNSPSDTPLKIILGQEVTEVNVQEDKRVVIRCRNNETYKTDAVIVTLPLGVLKVNDVKFTPDLSTKKQNAINRVGFGTVNKLVIEFNKRFWPEDTQHISVAVRDIADRGKFTFMTSFYAIANKPVIVTYAASQFGEESEKMSNNQLKNLALRRLRTAFGTALDPVKVVRMSRTRWKRDRFSRGSYSFPALGMEEGDWDILGQPEPPLFFAGEHTRTKQYGTVQTAIDTGRKAAKEVETYLNLVNSGNMKVLSSFVILCTLLLSVFHVSL